MEEVLHHLAADQHPDQGMVELEVGMHKHPVAVLGKVAVV